MSSPNTIDTELTQTDETPSVEFYELDGETLLGSLWVSEDNIEAFADNYIIQEVLVVAEQSEREMEDIFMNSLLIEDSLLDSFMDENWVDKVIF